MRPILWWILVCGLCGCGQQNHTPIPDAAVSTSVDVEVTDAQRKGRFLNRPVVDLPRGMPRAWRRLIQGLDARVYHAEYGELSHAKTLKGDRTLKLKLRLFGRDAEVEDRLIAGFKTLGLPGVESGLPKDRIDAGSVSWSMKVGRLVAPAGAERETRVSIEWRRKVPKPTESPRCRKPAERAAPSTTPTWLVSATAKRTTRRRVATLARMGIEGQMVVIKMLYRNGFAHDENVGQLTQAAVRRGLSHVSGTGPRQLWKGPGGEVLELSPVSQELNLGCTVRGPVLEIVWSREGKSKMVRRKQQ